MNDYVLDFRDIDQSRVAVVGGKGAHLGELSRIEGDRVPPGFCITTAAFFRIMSGARSIGDLLHQLSRAKPDDRTSIRALSAEIREALQAIAIPDDIAAVIARALTPLGEGSAFAVRSSATAEDSPTASFAGQHDTYLNVVGTAAVLEHISRCWASLFTERAVTYRMRNGFDHRKVRMAVIVQRMVLPEAAGILFTADPVTGNRKVASIDAGFGLGEALVSGLVNADVYKVRDNAVVSKTIARKELAIVADSSGGTEHQAIAPARQYQPTLTDDQAVTLATLGRRIEAHFRAPQDIEWCLLDGDFYILQSRPITTLFPVPVVADGENHVYISVGHQQMMTDAWKPLGISMRQMLSGAVTFHEAGGRLFVDVTRGLASPASRANLLGLAGKSDPLIGDALQTILDRDDFIRERPNDGPVWALPGSGAAPIETDPAIVNGLIRRSEESIAALKRDIRTRSGSDLFEFILADHQELKRLLTDPLSTQALMAGMEGSWWLNDHLQQWLGEKNVADTLAQSAPDNVTSAMGLALLDVADVIRQHPDVVTFLQRVEDDVFLDELPRLAGGRESRDAILGFLDTYGMRCVGEIDITRPRWSEHPAALVPMVLSNVRNFEPGAAARRFERGRQEAQRKEEDVLRRLRAMPNGDGWADEVKRMIDRVRTFVGYREYPKYGMVRRLFVYKQAMLEEAERLVDAHVIGEKEDVFYLTFQEFHDAVRTRTVDDNVIRERKEAFRSYEALTPPRVLTSDGEVVTGSYRREVYPAGALVGLPVSVGTVEGRARVVLEIANADLDADDILVTTCTDPSWTPLFVAIKGLVTEVGGLMTHGSVIAREYGLPAVVGVENATGLIRDGQRIRVNGTEGYVEILSEPDD